NESYQQLFAQVLQKLKVEHALVVCSHQLDELSLLGPSKILEIRGLEKNEWVLDPQDFGFKYGKLSDIQGGDAQTNARILLEAFEGKKGPVADTLILNAAVGLYAANHVKTLQEGITMARENLGNHNTLNTLKNWVEASHA